MYLPILCRRNRVCGEFSSGRNMDNQQPTIANSDTVANSNGLGKTHLVLKLKIT